MMEEVYSSTTEMQALWPAFMMHRVWEMPDAFNQKLYELGKVYSAACKVTDPDNPKNVGNTSNHLCHVRDNFLLQYKDEPEVKVFAEMVDTMCRDYLQSVYNYKHDGPITMEADMFYQRRSHRENVGINMHTHPKCDLVLTYYPWLHLDEEANTPLHQGAMRIYDPANIGKRFWPCKNPNAYYGGWYSIVPQIGSMIIFEGWIPHDSTYFSGDDRMCIPILCDVITPSGHEKVDSRELIF